MPILRAEQAIYPQLVFHLLGLDESVRLHIKYGVPRIGEVILGLLFGEYEVLPIGGQSLIHVL